MAVPRLSVTHSNNESFSYFRWVRMPGHLPLTGGFRGQMRRPSANPNVALEVEFSTSNGRILLLDVDEANERVKLGFELPENISRPLIGIYNFDLLYEANGHAERLLVVTWTFEQGPTQ